MRITIQFTPAGHIETVFASERASVVTYRQLESGKTGDVLFGASDGRKASDESLIPANQQTLVREAHEVILPTREEAPQPKARRKTGDPLLSAQPISLLLSEGLKARMDEWCARRVVNRCALVRRLLREFLDGEDRKDLFRPTG